MFRKLSSIIDGILFIPIIIIVLVLALPVIVIIIIKSIIDHIKDKKELKRQLQLNDKKIFFFYSEYNNYDFSNYFKEYMEEITCVKVDEVWRNSIFVNHLIQDGLNKRFPLLVKIEDGILIKKKHFGSFKHLFKRNHDIDSFLDLINRSIKNLKRHNH